MPFRRDALLCFAELAPTTLEIAESIDMLRFLEHGYPVHMVETTLPTQAVDTPEDLDLVERMLGACYPSNPEFDLQDCIDAIHQNPEWENINRHIEQKKL